MVVKCRVPILVAFHLVLSIACSDVLGLSEFAGEVLLDGGGTDTGAADGGGRGDAAVPMDASVGVDAGTSESDGGQAYDGGVDGGGPSLPITEGLIQHLDARDVLGTGGSTPAEVSSWVDLASSDAPPRLSTCENVLWISDALNGYPAVRTTGADNSRCFFPVTELDSFTVFVVFRTTDRRSTGSNWWENAVLLGGDALGRHADGALYLAAGRIGFGRGGDGFQFYDAFNYADDRVHVLGLTRVGATGGMMLRVDGRTVVGMAEAGPISAPSVWWLASHNEGRGGRLANDYGEVLLYSRTLSADQFDEVHRYLRTRWDL